MQYGKPRKYDHVSRYGKYRQILTDENTVYTETFNDSIIDQTDNDKFHTVLKEQENRLDIIANIYYKDPSMYWVIALANKLIDPFIVDVGSILRIPAYTSLYKFGGVLNTNE